MYSTARLWGGFMPDMRQTVYRGRVAAPAGTMTRMNIRLFQTPCRSTAVPAALPLARLCLACAWSPAARTTTAAAGRAPGGAAGHGRRDAPPRRHAGAGRLAQPRARPARLRPGHALGGDAAGRRALGPARHRAARRRRPAGRAGPGAARARPPHARQRAAPGRRRACGSRGRRAAGAGQPRARRRPGAGEADQRRRASTNCAPRWCRRRRARRPRARSATACACAATTPRCARPMPASSRARIVQPGQVVAAGSELLRADPPGPAGMAAGAAGSRAGARAGRRRRARCATPTGAQVSKAACARSRPASTPSTRTGTIYADLPEPGALQGRRLRRRPRAHRRLAPAWWCRPRRW